MFQEENPLVPGHSSCFVSLPARCNAKISVHPRSTEVARRYLPMNVTQSCTAHYWSNISTKKKRKKTVILWKSDYYRTTINAAVTINARKWEIHARAERLKHLRRTRSRFTNRAYPRGMRDTNNNWSGWFNRIHNVMSILELISAAGCR